jgi:bacillithiol system protein YtxJ
MRQDSLPAVAGETKMPVQAFDQSGPQIPTGSKSHRMGLFNRIMGQNATAQKAPIGRTPWHNLDHRETLDQVIARSHELPVLLFKHSTRCSISSMALSRVEHAWSFEPDQIEPWFLDLISHRDISHAIAERLGVPHQSPQAIIVRNGEVIYNASHSGISVADMAAAISASAEGAA